MGVFIENIEETVTAYCKKASKQIFFLQVGGVALRAWQKIIVFSGKMKYRR